MHGPTHKVVWVTLPVGGQRYKQDQNVDEEDYILIRTEIDGDRIALIFERIDVYAKRYLGQR
jgi:hypothetical protein